MQSTRKWVSLYFTNIQMKGPSYYLRISESKNAYVLMKKNSPDFHTVKFPKGKLESKTFSTVHNMYEVQGKFRLIALCKEIKFQDLSNSSMLLTMRSVI